MNAVVIRVSVLSTDRSGMSQISKTNGLRERWISIINPPTGVLRCRLFFSTGQKSAQRFCMETKDMRTTPQKAMRVGSPTTIHRANKC